MHGAKKCISLLGRRGEVFMERRSSVGRSGDSVEQLLEGLSDLCVRADFIGNSEYKSKFQDFTCVWWQRRRPKGEYYAD